MNELPKIVIPLDGMTKEKALEIAELLAGKVWFKVNDLLVQCGVGIVEELKKFGPVFADPKLYDIPNTVANSVKKLYGSALITIHASGGVEMMRAAVNAAEGSYSEILAVTVLTSFDEDDVYLIYGTSIKATVLAMARNAVLAGVHGMVCSPQELAFLSKFPELKGLRKVIPGIRPTWYQEKDDQKRTMTPGEATKLGADLLVIGRPILNDPDPVAAVERTLAEIETALAEGGK